MPDIMFLQFNKLHNAGVMGGGMLDASGPFDVKNCHFMDGNTDQEAVTQMT